MMITPFAPMIEEYHNMSEETTITIANLSARILGRALRDPRIKHIAIDYYATEAFDELLRQLPEPGEADAPSDAPK